MVTKEWPKKKRKEKRWTHIYTKNMPWDLFTRFNNNHLARDTK